MTRRHSNAGSRLRWNSPASTTTTLADRIATQNYGASTLRNIANPNHPREARFADLIVIARACRVSEAFFRVDFLELEEPSLRAEVSRLRADLEELSLAVLRQSGEPPADAGADLPAEPPGDGQQ